jgi:phosphoserine phosphatase RsbU/P
MSRIVLLVDHVENRRLLAEWLSRSPHASAGPQELRHEVVVPETPATILDACGESSFDLGIVDRPALERYGRWIDAVKASVHPVFLPFLALAHRPRGGMKIDEVWARVDELIITPVEKLELHARVENLLRERHLSLANDALRRRLAMELARARAVQAGLLPCEAPNVRGFELAARCIPAREVGGDFYDWETVDGEAVVSVGDVMGKGIPAALLATTVRAVLRAVARQNPPSAALDLLQQTLSGDLERTASFVTLFHARLEAGSREVRYVDAGHGHAVVRRGTGVVEHLERGGRPVGFPANAPYREASVRLRRGDILFVYSDGLCFADSRGAEEILHGVEPSAPASSIVDQLVKRAARQETADDVTVLVLKCVA